MEDRSEQRILRKGNSTAVKHKEMFNSLGHRKDENQNFFEMPSYTSQNG